VTAEVQPLREPPLAIRPGESLRIGRYEVAERIAAGGMATVHLGRQHGDFGFARVVAIKRLLPQYCEDPEFESMFIDEARLAARITHPNVVSILDVVAVDGELLLVMDYVHGESLWRLLGLTQKAASQLPIEIASSVICDVLHGLHAAHEAKDRRGNPLEIVHRDVSPQNVIVGEDGVARVLDFGIAKAADSVHFTRAGTIRGKAAYMAPEQISGSGETRHTDLFAVGVMLWELLTTERLFAGSARADIARRLSAEIPLPSARNAAVPPALDAVVMTALASDPEQRFADAQQMASALETACPAGGRAQVVEWVRTHAAPRLEERAALTARLEASGTTMRPPAPSGGPSRPSHTTQTRAATVPLPAVTPQTPAATTTASTAGHGAKAFEGPTTAEYHLRESSGGPVTGSRSLKSRRGLQKWFGGSSPRVRAALAGMGAPLVLTLIVWAFTSSPAELREAGAAVSGASPVTTPAAQVQSVTELDPALGIAEPAPSPTPSAAPPTPSSSTSQLGSSSKLSGHPEQPARPKAEPTPAPRTVNPNKPATKAATPRKGVKRGCKPPYTTDSAGRRHYKAECFK
jgi:serine/threonine-protein kinase